MVGRWAGEYLAVFSGFLTALYLVQRPVLHLLLSCLWTNPLNLTNKLTLTFHGKSETRIVFYPFQTNARMTDTTHTKAVEEAAFSGVLVYISC